MTEEVQTGRYPIATIADIANIADIADIADFENPIKKYRRCCKLPAKHSPSGAPLSYLVLIK